MNLGKSISFGLRIATALFLLLVLSSASTISRAQSYRGGIRGEITDAKDLRVAGARVIARNLATSETREVTADESGEYRFVELPAGHLRSFRNGARLSGGSCATGAG